MSDEFKLEEQEKQLLLQIARSTIESYARTGKKPKLPPASQLSENFKSTRGAFVSLHIKGLLRGCIGIFEGRGPLYQTISDMALAAGWEDPRFPGLEESELTELEIEISVLSPLTKACAEEIEVGRHGIYVTKGFARGVLLPQVATEYCWDRETFLCQTCIKAGLPANSWKEADTKIEVFSADIFKEKDFK
jgi:AmmeMemoRadiSam system protein A